MQVGETRQSRLDFDPTPPLRPPSKLTQPKHMTSLLSLAIGLSRLGKDSGHVQWVHRQSGPTDRQVCPPTIKYMKLINTITLWTNNRKPQVPYYYSIFSEHLIYWLLSGCKENFNRYDNKWGMLLTLIWAAHMSGLSSSAKGFYMWQNACILSFLWCGSQCFLREVAAQLWRDLFL